MTGFPDGVGGWEIEGSAETIHRMAGADASSPPGPAWLAQRLLGDGCIRMRSDMKARATLARADSAWRIYLRADAGAEAGYLIGHELAEWYYRDRQLEPNMEEACNRLGAALCAPRLAMVSVLTKLRPSVQRLAKMLVCTETLAILRIAETTGCPTALVSTHKVWIRGEPHPAFDSEPRAREIAAAPPVRGIRRRRLSDAQHRIAILVA